MGSQPNLKLAIRSACGTPCHWRTGSAPVLDERPASFRQGSSKRLQLPPTTQRKTVAIVCYRNNEKLKQAVVVVSYSATPGTPRSIDIDV